MRTRVGDLLVRRLGAVANLRVVTLGRLAADLVAAARGAPPWCSRASPASGSCGAWSRPVRRARLLRPGRRPAALRRRRWRRRSPTCARRASPPDSAWSDAVARPPRRARARAPAQGARSGPPVPRVLSPSSTPGGCSTAPACSWPRPPWPRGQRMPGDVVLYGIYDLNQAQEAFVRALVATGADVFVPVPAAGSRAALTALDVALPLGLEERRLAVAPAATATGNVCARSGARASGGEPPRARRRRHARRGLRVRRARRAARGGAGRPGRRSSAERPPGTARWSCRTATTSSSPRRPSARPGLPLACREPDRSRGRAAAGPPGRLSRAAGRRAVRAARGHRPVRRRRRCAAAARPARPRCGSTRPGRPAWWPGPTSGPRASRAGAAASSGGSPSSRRAARRRGRRRGRGVRQDRGRAAAPCGAARPAGRGGRARRRLRPPARARPLGRLGGVLRRRRRPRCSTPRRAAQARDAASRLQALAVLDEEVDFAEAAAALRELLAARASRTAASGATASRCSRRSSCAA